jgi:aspartate racemase
VTPVGWGCDYSMNKTRCLGLVGGLGVGATIHYYEKLANAIEALGLTPDIVIIHAEISRVFEYVQAGDRNGLAEYLVGYVRRLKAAGAEIAAIPALTPHFCVHQLIAMSPLPVCNIFDPLVRELAARGVKRAAIFGTRFVMESALFGELGDVEIVKPTPDEMNYIHSTYIELARTGKGTEQQHRDLTALAQTIVRRDKVDVIILAGTDLALLFNATNTDFPYIDCAELHISQILKSSIGESSLSPR